MSASPIPGTAGAPRQHGIARNSWSSRSCGRWYWTIITACVIFSSEGKTTPILKWRQHNLRLLAKTPRLNVYFWLGNFTGRDFWNKNVLMTIVWAMRIECKSPACMIGWRWVSREVSLFFFSLMFRAPKVRQGCPDSWWVEIFFWIPFRLQTPQRCCYWCSNALGYRSITLESNSFSIPLASCSFSYKTKATQNDELKASVFVLTQKEMSLMIPGSVLSQSYSLPAVPLIQPVSVLHRESRGSLAFRGETAFPVKMGRRGCPGKW